MFQNGLVGQQNNGSKNLVNQDRTKKSEGDLDKDDLKRGKILMVIFILLMVILGGIYIYAHYQSPAGLFSPTKTAFDAVNEAKTALAAASLDVLEPDLISNIKRLSNRLSLLAPQLGANADYNATLAQIDAELSGPEVHRAVLSPLFDRIGNLIQVGSGIYFWYGSRDLWIELLFWTVIGNLVFLLSEVKKYSSMPYQDGKRDFIKYTPWYAANFFRGPFIAMLILLALTSISFVAMGITVDIKSSPIVLIVLAAVLGYYSRVADKQLDIIAERLLPEAWKKANPDKVLVIEPHEQPLTIKAKGTKDFTVQPNLPVRWILIKGEGDLQQDGRYTAPEKIINFDEATLLAVPEDDEYNVARVKVTLVPDSGSTSGDQPAGGNGSQPTTAEVQPAPAAEETSPSPETTAPPPEPTTAEAQSTPATAETPI